MMKQACFKTALLIASIGLVVSCSSANTQSQNTTLGAVTGAVVGGVAGSAIGAGTGQIVAIGAGAIAGALIGGYVGQSMDHSDNVQTYYALEHTPKQKAYHWKNKKTGKQYTVIPSSKHVAMKGYSDCRKYTVVADIKGKKQRVHGVACRQADGSWKAIK
ncbi:MAG: glycine zipper 2TM domain-containing protein [Gammaproteobacteria bacterium]|nr:glycine zipper 2TM domain-containing protein [Gammaproteobacteria bacterium]MCW5582755.1 glycine zipper 2TM domain-containing protein [Gammaproteobacteria bacterium]